MKLSPQEIFTLFWTLGSRKEQQKKFLAKERLSNNFEAWYLTLSKCRQGL
jgi:hypothetical protein